MQIPIGFRPHTRTVPPCGLFSASPGAAPQSRHIPVCSMNIWELDPFFRVFPFAIKIAKSGASRILTRATLRSYRAAGRSEPHATRLQMFRCAAR